MIISCPWPGGQEKSIEKEKSCAWRCIMMLSQMRKRSFSPGKKDPKASIALLFECNIWDNCPKGLIFPNLIWGHNKTSNKTVFGVSVLTLIIKTHCLPSSVFIEHLQCTRHNRTYRKHCPCSRGAYILKEKKNTPLLKWYFCLVFSARYWGNSL